MSLYNMIMGFSPACLLVMPMLGRKQSEYPRFRDCHINAKDTREIHIFTREGSLNQNCGYGEEALYDDPNYLRFKDDSYDPTYGTYVFKCPNEWEADFDAISEGNIEKLSEAFYEMQKKFWGENGDKAVETIKMMVSQVKDADGESQ